MATGTSTQGESGSQDDHGGVELGARQVRSVYLLTYSQADVEATPTRGSFAAKVVAAFTSIGWGLKKPK